MSRLKCLGRKALFAQKLRVTIPEKYHAGLYRCADLLFLRILGAVYKLHNTTALIAGAVLYENSQLVNRVN